MLFRRWARLDFAAVVALGGQRQHWAVSADAGLRTLSRRREDSKSGAARASPASSSAAGSARADLSIVISGTVTGAACASYGRKA
eukprot:16430513-Heterocapsa_arctica.AAC.1